MNTPICDFVKKYADANPVRLHMPGHKGRGSAVNALDITEIDGADVLYHGSGIIAESERNAASLFGTYSTLYSAEGSSLSIRAMVYLTCLYAKSKGEKPFILAGRNAHKVFVSACALLDADIQWIYPDCGSCLQCKITPESLEKAVAECEAPPTALYITSPDYTGNIADVKALAAVCRKYGMLLITDNAHGAYLRFMPEDEHPITLGVDLCCDSAHKTLNALTGCAYLHISQSAPDVVKQNASSAMALFASTSPSYIIMQSLDALNPYLSDGFRADLEKTAAKVNSFKAKLEESGYEICGDEKTKVTIKAKSYGYTGSELAQILQRNCIFPEFSDPDFLVLMFSVSNTDADFEKAEKVLLSVPAKQKITALPPEAVRVERAVSPREALMSAGEWVNAEDAEGRVLADLTVACPPAVPIVICGEKISAEAVKAFRYYGTEKVKVIK